MGKARAGREGNEVSEGAKHLRGLGDAVMLAGLLFQAAWVVAVLLHGAQGRAYTGRRKLANFAVERYPSAAAAANIHPPTGTALP